jgi:hypothetical protein
MCWLCEHLVRIHEQAPPNFCTQNAFSGHENAFLTWILFLLVIEIFPDTWEWQKHDLCAWECISDVDCISARFRISWIREWRKSISVSDNTILMYFARCLQLFRHAVAEHKYQQQKACPWSCQSMALVCRYRVRCTWWMTESWRRWKRRRLAGSFVFALAHSFLFAYILEAIA